MIDFMNDTETLRERAVALRRAGKSRREIKDALGLGSNWAVGQLLDGERPTEWTKRPNAKDDLRDRARRLRADGCSYVQIAARLGVSKSSVSRWTKDVSTPVLEERKRRRSAEGEARRLEGLAAWQESTRRQRAIERQVTKFEAGTEIGELSKQELVMLGAIAYWCEGGKDKVYNRRERVDFINSDPNLIRLFLRFLEVVGVPQSRLRFRVHIHETASVEDATDYWAEIVGTEPTEFRKTVIKKHSPRTNRKNRSEDYRGCLQVGVLRSAELYWRIEGWAYGAMVGDVVQSKPAVATSAPSTFSGIPQRLRTWRRP